MSAAFEDLLEFYGSSKNPRHPEDPDKSYHMDPVLNPDTTRREYEEYKDRVDLFRVYID